MGALSTLRVAWHRRRGLADRLRHRRRLDSDAQTLALELFETAFDQAPIGMSLVDLDGRWLKVNRVLCEIVGWPEEELLKRAFQDITHPDDLPASDEKLRELLDGAIGRFQADKRYIARDGREIWANLSVSLVRDARGAPRHFIGQIQDISQRKHYELALRNERDYAAAITRSMLDGFLLTRDGAILEVNQALCELTGFDREELLNMRIPFPFWAPESVEDILAYRGQITPSHHAEFETVFMRPDGSRFPVAVHTVPAEAHDGTRLGLVTTVRDISERKRHEEELHRLATQDPLTGLANHRVFHEQLRAEVARARRQQLRLSVAILDLDHFKQVNDRHGHPVGDQVLREAGTRLRASVREGEVLARVGGEEFAWILTGLDECGAYAAVERARQLIGETAFAEAGIVTISAGVAELWPGEAADDLYSRADQALYRAKQSGRNRTVGQGPADPDGLTLSAA